MRSFNQIQQVNSLVKHATRNDLTISSFEVHDNIVFANLKNADGSYSYMTMMSNYECIEYRCAFIR